MPAKRLEPKKPHQKPWILQEPDEPEPEPAHATCPSCGTQALLTDHACSHCGQVFFERKKGKAAQYRERTPAHAPDPSIQEFASRMEQTERVTRVLCTLGGLLFGLLFIVSLLGLGGISGGFYADALLLFLAVVCLLRGLRGGEADLRFLASLGDWMPWRWRR
jgi:hypothetical protein